MSTQPIITNNDISSLDSSKLVVIPPTGFTSVSQNTFNTEIVNKRNMLTTVSIVPTITASTISPDFTYDAYCVDSNYSSTSVSISWVSGSTMPIWGCEKNVNIKNTKGSTQTFVLQTSPLVSNGITYTFIDMKNVTITVPTGKYLDINYLFIQRSETAFDVSILYLVGL